MALHSRRAEKPDGSVAVFHFSQPGRLTGHYLRQPKISHWVLRNVVIEDSFSNAVDASLSLDDAIGALWPDAFIGDPVLEPGQHHPRIWRGPYSPALHGDKATADSRAAGDESAWIRTGRAGLSLANLLREVLAVVEPDMRNEHVFGPAIRQLLNAACTEVETCLLGIMRANKAKLDKHPTTKDYVRVFGPMKLGHYQFKLDGAPAMREISPFMSWKAGDATKSLPWYHANNKAKHEQEREPEAPTLIRALEAVAAHTALAIGQFGQDALQPFDLPATARFTCTRMAMWDPDDLYVPRSDGTWEAKPLFNETTSEDEPGSTP